MHCSMLVSCPSTTRAKLTQPDSTHPRSCACQVHVWLHTHNLKQALHSLCMAGLCWGTSTCCLLNQIHSHSRAPGNNLQPHSTWKQTRKPARMQKDTMDNSNTRPQTPVNGSGGAATAACTAACCRGLKDSCQQLKGFALPASPRAVM